MIIVEKKRTIRRIGIGKGLERGGKGKGKQRGGKGKAHRVVGYVMEWKTVMRRRIKENKKSQPQAT